MDELCIPVVCIIITSFDVLENGKKSHFPQLHTMYPHTNSHNLLEEGSEPPSEMNKYFFVQIILKMDCVYIWTELVQL